MPPDPELTTVFGFILVTTALLTAIGMLLWFLDRRDTRRIELRQDLVEAVAQASGPEVLAAVSTLIQLEYGEYGRDRLRLVADLLEAKTRLISVHVAQQASTLAELESSTGKLRRSLRELPAAAKRYLP